MRILLGTVAALTLLAGAADAQEVKLGYINKMGDHPWFVSEVAGAKAKATELGNQLLVQDVQFDANLTITTMDTYLGRRREGHRHRRARQGARPGGGEEGQGRRHPADRGRRRHHLRGRQPGALCRHRRADHRQAGGCGDRPAGQGGGLGQGLVDRSRRQRRGPEGRHLHAAQPGRRGGLPRGLPRLPQGEHRPHPLRQHHGQRDRRGRHHADRQPGRRALGVLLLQRRRRAGLGAGDRERRHGAGRRDRRRHRRLALLRGVRRRQAQRLPRHDVVRIRRPTAPPRSPPCTTTSPTARPCRWSPTCPRS